MTITANANDPRTQMNFLIQYERKTLTLTAWGRLRKPRRRAIRPRAIAHLFHEGFQVPSICGED